MLAKKRGFRFCKSRIIHERTRRIGMATMALPSDEASAATPTKGGACGPTGPAGPFTIKNIEIEASDGPRSLSPSSSSSSDSGGDRAVNCPAENDSRGSSGSIVVMEAKGRTGVRDTFSVAVAMLGVACFTVLGPLTLLGPLWCAAKYGAGSIVPYVALVMGTYALPHYYSPYFKKVIWRPIMLELTNYVRPFKVIKHCNLPSDSNYIICWHPHGRLFYGFAVLCGLFDVFFPELGDREFFGGINDPLFAIPLLGNLLSLTGTIPCNRKAIDRTLQRGDNLGLIVGGVEEVLEGTFPGIFPVEFMSRSSPCFCEIRPEGPPSALCERTPVHGSAPRPFPRAFSLCEVEPSGSKRWSPLA